MSRSTRNREIIGMINNHALASSQYDDAKQLCGRAIDNTNIYNQIKGIQSDVKK